MIIMPACITMALGLSSPATAYLYWTTYGTTHSGGIARAGLDGGDTTEGFIPNPFRPGPGEVSSIAISGPYIYFGGGGTGGLIGRASIDGGQVDPDLLRIPQPPLLPPGPTARTERDADSVAVADGHIYWSTGDPLATEPSRYGIGRASVDGDNVEDDFIASAVPVLTVSIYAGRLYWLTEDAIGRARLDGSDVEPEFIHLPRTPVSFEVAVAGGYIYWAGENAIARADIAHRSVDSHFITGLGVLGAVATAGGSIYWLESTLDRAEHAQTAWISRATTAGTEVRTHLVGVDSGPVLRSLPGTVPFDAVQGVLAVDTRGPQHTAKQGRRHRPLNRTHRT